MTWTNLKQGYDHDLTKPDGANKKINLKKLELREAIYLYSTYICHYCAKMNVDVNCIHCDRAGHEECFNFNGDNEFECGLG